MSYSPKTVAALRGLVNAVIVAVFFAGAAVLSDGKVTDDELVLAASGLLGVLAARWQEAFTLDSANLPSSTPLGSDSFGGERGHYDIGGILVIVAIAILVWFCLSAWGLEGAKVGFD